jgi:hypothetical protein
MGYALLSPTIEGNHRDTGSAAISTIAARDACDFFENCEYDMRRFSRYDECCRGRSRSVNWIVVRSAPARGATPPYVRALDFRPSLPCSCEPAVVRAVGKGRPQRLPTKYLQPFRAGAGPPGTDTLVH